LVLNRSTESNFKQLHIPKDKEETDEGKRSQHYHRYVLAMLSGERFSHLLGLEPQKKGEGEVGYAMRLQSRILIAYSRAFDMVVADGLYLEAPFVRLLLGYGKDVIVVLKDERRGLL